MQLNTSCWVAHTCLSRIQRRSGHILIAAAIAINWAYLPANEAIANDPTCGNVNVSSSMLSVAGLCYTTSKWTVLCGRTQQPVATASGRDSRDNETARTLPVVTVVASVRQRNYAVIRDHSLPWLSHCLVGQPSSFSPLLIMRRVNRRMMNRPARIPCLPGRHPLAITTDCTQHNDIARTLNARRRCIIITVYSPWQRNRSPLYIHKHARRANTA